MDADLLKRYLKYANTEEAFAVLFVKKHVGQAKGHWVDVLDCRRFEESPDKLHFRFVMCGLYKRKLHPKYPPESAFTVDGRFDEQRYYQMVRAITWETAHMDIQQQKAKKLVPVKFRITGVFYEKTRSLCDYFLDDAPPEIKALANNLSDRTNPLWDAAIRYVRPTEYVYEIKQVRKIQHRRPKPPVC